MHSDFLHFNKIKAMKVLCKDRKFNFDSFYINKELKKVFKKRKSLPLMKNKENLMREEK